MDDEQHKLILETLEIVFEFQLTAVRQALGKEDLPVDATRRRSTKRKSLIDLTLEILTGSQGAVHVDEIVKMLRERHERVTDRDSLSSALAKKAKQGQLIRKVSPATYEIID